MVPTIAPVRVSSSDRPARSGRRQLGEPEVGELRASVVRDEDVLGLDVAVQNAGAVRRRERVGDPNQQIHDFLNAATAGIRPGAQRTALDELGDQVVAAVHLADVVHGHDVRVVQPGGGLCLVLKAAARGCVVERIRQHLDCDATVETHVRRLVHDSHTAGSDKRLDPVRTDGACDRRVGVGGRVKHRRRREEPLHRRFAGQHRLQLPEELLIAGAFGGHERLTLFAPMCQCGMVDARHFRPPAIGGTARGVHVVFLPPPLLSAS